MKPAPWASRSTRRSRRTAYLYVCVSRTDGGEWRNQVAALPREQRLELHLRSLRHPHRHARELEPQRLRPRVRRATASSTSRWATPNAPQTPRTPTGSTARSCGSTATARARRQPGPAGCVRPVRRLQHGPPQPPGHRDPGVDRAESTPPSTVPTSTTRSTCWSRARTTAGRVSVVPQASPGSVIPAGPPAARPSRRAAPPSRGLDLGDFQHQLLRDDPQGAGPAPVRRSRRWPRLPRGGRRLRRRVRRLRSDHVGPGRRAVRRRRSNGSGDRIDPADAGAPVRKHPVASHARALLERRRSARPDAGRPVTIHALTTGSSRRRGCGGKTGSLLVLALALVVAACSSGASPAASRAPSGSAPAASRLGTGRLRARGHLTEEMIGVGELLARDPRPSPGLARAVSGGRPAGCPDPRRPPGRRDLPGTQARARRARRRLRRPSRRSSRKRPTRSTTTPRPTRSRPCTKKWRR